MATTEQPAKQVLVTSSAADAQWYKDAIVYQLHVRAFRDSNGDGIGDFVGLTQNLDYLQDLGVTRCGCCRSILRRSRMTAMTLPIT